jgi:hypothetical protein
VLYFVLLFVFTERNNIAFTGRKLPFASLTGLTALAPGKGSHLVPRGRILLIPAGGHLITPTPAMENKLVPNRGLLHLPPDDVR